MIGTILGSRYELIEKIGEGGMAVVYKAKCRLLNRYVAVKILKDEYTSNFEFTDKFRKEAAAAASFSHNNIVNVFDVGVEGKYNYIVMELVNGKTLKKIINERGNLPYEEVVSIGIQIAKALECAHKNGIIHRDIKPHNILVTEDGTVKVTDFGIAKASNTDTITHTSKVIGSAHYFSPEQAKGKVVDFRTDIYSLGIVLYEMATGKLPFDGDSPVSIALKHIQEPVVPPSAINYNIPVGLSNLIMKAIEKDPIKRYQTATELLNDLKKIQNNQDYTIVQNTNIDEDYTRVMDPVQVDKIKASYKKNDFEEEDFDDEDDDFEEEEPKKKATSKGIDKKKKKMIIISFATIFLVILGIFSSAIYSKMVNPKPNSSKEIKVPSILGKTEEQGKKMVEDLGLVFVVDGKEKNDKPKGTIIKCIPNVGTTVKKNFEVKVILSEGPEEIKVPDLRNTSSENAQNEIVSLGLRVGTITEENNETYSEGTVIRQDPQPYALVKKGDAVNIVVSKGSSIKSTVVPSLKGESIDAAESILSISKLKLGEKVPVITDDISKDGIIFNQSIASGTKVKEQEVINVNYYKYEEPKPEKVIVPDFRGETVKDAKELAASLGLNVQVSGNDDDIVESQDITPDTKIDKGETIKLTVKAKEPEDDDKTTEPNQDKQ
ncbi:Stk1 family PASTA domain-containing Ser/Thr kinase [Clostridium butanoliproducens]|uniref:Stk1 family PASTA domain-containing Ser/Thr kinase n=1 Tax=Clostridium butanoliproducens TaxID=2991837 RepID=UPI0024BAC18B|nr:Stk1 family PASTA domain-containing Ser/Thr kinase [Clostridium butanoliproducens]